MKKLLFIVIAASLFFACNSGTDNENKQEQNSNEQTETTEQPETKAEQTTDDFEVFWNKVQQAVAQNDKEALKALCNDNMKGFLDGNYDNFIDDRMRQEVAKTTVNEIEDRDEQKLFIYHISHGSPDENGQVFSSSFGFWFEKVDGKWMIANPQMGG